MRGPKLSMSRRQEMSMGWEAGMYARIVRYNHELTCPWYLLISSRRRACPNA